MDERDGGREARVCAAGGGRREEGRGEKGAGGGEGRGGEGGFAGQINGKANKSATLTCRSPPLSVYFIR